jgi:hypothetical protein
MGRRCKASCECHGGPEATLGKVQRSVLEALRRHGSWHGEGWGCGWVWTTPSATRLILRSLVRRGLVTESNENGRTYFRPAVGA